MEMAAAAAAMEMAAAAVAMEMAAANSAPQAHRTPLLIPDHSLQQGGVSILEAAGEMSDCHQLLAGPDAACVRLLGS